MASAEAQATSWRDPRLATLERLLGIDATELKPALDEASDLLAETLDADKVDAFLYDVPCETLVAVGTSNTPMGRRQHLLGLNRLSIADGGQAANAFLSGESYLSRRADRDASARRDIVEGLGVRTEMTSPFDVAGERRGVLQAMSRRPEHFSEEDLAFFRAAAGWVGMMASRAELVERRRRDAVEQGDRLAMEDIAAVLTPRQREIAVLLARGYTNRRIAEELVLTSGTVANHIEHILNRLRLRSRAQVAVWAVNHRLVSAPS